MGVKEPVDVGLALYEKVAPWLPEGAIAQPEIYTVEEGFTGDDFEGIASMYLWQEEQLEGNGSTGVYIDMKDMEKTFHYKRDLRILISSDGEIIEFYYGCDEGALNLEEFLSGCNLDYAEKEVQSLVTDGKQLQISQRSDATGYQSYMSENTLQDYRYEVGFIAQGGYQQYLRKYYDNPEQCSQLQNWLSGQVHQQMENAFNLERVGQFYQQLGTQSRQGDLYTVKMDSYMISWRPQLTKQQWAQLDELIEHDPEGHQFVWKYLNLNYNSLYSFELSAPILEDGTLDLEQAAAYPVHSVDNRSYRAEMPLDWQQEEERWQMLWAAAHFAQGYTEKQQAMMDFFGTVNGLDFASYDYNTTVSYLLNECDKKSKDFTGMSGYDLQIELPNETQSNDYLTMTLEQIDSQWQVTDALLEK